jgi:hypothetical protein
MGRRGAAATNGWERERGGGRLHRRVGKMGEAEGRGSAAKRIGGGGCKGSGATRVRGKDEGASHPLDEESTAHSPCSRLSSRP